MEEHIHKEDMVPPVGDIELSDPHKSNRLSLAPLVLCAVLLIVSLISTYLYFFYQKQPVTTKKATQVAITKAAKPDYNLTAISLEQDIASASYTIIPKTDLEIKIPESYKIRKSVHDYFLPISKYTLTARTDIAQIREDFVECKAILRTKASLDYGFGDENEPYINQKYCTELLKTGFKPSPEEDNPYFKVPNANTFDIDVIATPSSVVDWIRGNDTPQGETLTLQYVTDKLTERVINGQTFYTYKPGCCGQWEIVYFYPYTYQEKKLLILFINQITSSVPDKFLETVLATLRKKQ